MTRSLRLIGGRLLGMLLTLVIASFVIFGALYLAPGSPITFLTHGRSMSPDAIKQLENQYHLNDPFFVRYWDWLSSALQGDFGQSIIYREDISSLLAPRAVNSIWLIAASAILVVLVGLSLGVFAGLRRGRLSGALIGSATVAMAIPSFVVAVVLTLIFAVDLRWFPAFSSGSGVTGRLYHLVLPATALALASVAFVARLTQTAVRHELGADHVQTAISRGLPYSVIVRKHVLRNAGIPMLTVSGLTVAGLIAGSVVVEQVFQLNGMGSYLVSAVQQKDFPVVQAICLIYVAAFIVLNTAIDFAYTLLDPRIGKEA